MDCKNNISQQKEKINNQLQELIQIQEENLNKEKKEEQFILLLHAINLTQNMKCTGLLEDDPEDNYIIPNNWNQAHGGVYSLKYKALGENIFFKLIVFGQQININCAYKETLFSLQIKLAELNLEDPKSEKNDEFYQQYQEKILKNLKLKEDQEKKEEESKSNQGQNQGGIGGDRIPFQQQQQQRPQQYQDPNVVGPYGRSDLDPFANMINPQNQGSLVGPDNPIFLGRGRGATGNRGNPHIRFDPLTPEGNDHSNMIPDNDMFRPQGGFGNNPFGGFGHGNGRGGGFGGGGFGGGGFGNGGFM